MSIHGDGRTSGRRAGAAWRAILAACALVLSGRPAAAQYHRYEAETGTRVGTVVRSNVAGYSGTGFVTGFDSGANADYVQLQVDVPDGLYEMWVGYRSVFGQKGYEFRVDAESGSGMFEKSETFSADRAGLFNVRGAVNTLVIRESWGYYDIDYLEFRPFTPPEVLPVAPVLSDPAADAPTRHLMNYLTSLYGEKTLSGQQHSSSQNLSFPVQQYLDKSAGLVPAIRSSDFMEYSPSRRQRGANPRNESEQSIAWAQQNGGVISMSWHWNAPANLVDAGEWPWWRGFYTQGTTFNLPAALANPAGSDYQLLLRDIDAIAVELQKFEDAGVPVIWRPLHEAQGGWFWWGAHGPEPFKQLWRLTHERLTEHHGLHNLIWEFTSSAAEGAHLDWYPGDDVVDMVGLDIYTDPTASMSGQWYDVLEHYNGRKPIALSETGTLPDPDLMELWGINWSYFSPWSGTFVDAFTPAALQATLGHENIVTLDELPWLPWSLAAPARSHGNFDGDADVDGDDFLTWQSLQGSSNPLADANEDGLVDAQDLAAWQTNFGAGGNQSPPETNSVPEPQAAALLAAAAALAVAARRTTRHATPIAA